MIVGIIRQKPELTHASIVCEGMLASVNWEDSENFGLLAADIDPVLWGTPANFNGFRVLASLLHGSQVYSERQLNFAALNRGRHQHYVRQGDHQVGHWPTF